jgi:aldehyde dehydrogenase (NAD+)
MSVLKFSSTEEVLARANDSPYGLAAACFTTSLDNALTASMALRAGVVWVNTYDILEACTPFGGYKQSGVGRELGEYGLQQYSEIKSIIIAVQQKNS